MELAPLHLQSDLLPTALGAVFIANDMDKGHIAPMGSNWQRLMQMPAGSHFYMKKPQGILFRSEKDTHSLHNALTSIP